MNSPEAVAYLERDYDQLDFGTVMPVDYFGEPDHAGLRFTRAPGWEPGSNVVRPMFSIIDDMLPYRHLEGE